MIDDWVRIVPKYDNKKLFCAQVVSIELANEFLKNFRDLIEEAGDLI